MCNICFLYIYLYLSCVGADAATDACDGAGTCAGTAGADACDGAGAWVGTGVCAGAGAFTDVGACGGAGASAGTDAWVANCFLNLSSSFFSKAIVTKYSFSKTKLINIISYILCRINN